MSGWPKSLQSDRWSPVQTGTWPKSVQSDNFVKSIFFSESGVFRESIQITSFLYYELRNLPVRRESERKEQNIAI